MRQTGLPLRIKPTFHQVNIFYQCTKGSRVWYWESKTSRQFVICTLKFYSVLESKRVALLVTIQGGGGL